MFAGEVEERIERLCLAFEAAKPALARAWNAPANGAGSVHDPAETPQFKDRMEVKS
jgi:hypothetical protein